MGNVGIDIKRDILVPMRDGVNLSTDVYLPEIKDSFPVLLMRTIYDKTQRHFIDWIPRFIERGYAVVIQDCRGKYSSEGKWEPYINEANDGYDCQEWIGQQSWCDGGIGMFGSSYDGYTQSLTAPLRSEYLKAPVPTVSQQDNFGHWYINGALQLHVPATCLILWARAIGDNPDMSNSYEITKRLPLISSGDGVFDSEFIRDAIRHNTFDEFWKNYSLRYKYDQVETPALFVSGWYDNLVHETFKLFKGWTTKSKSLKARNLTKILIGPWSHGNIGSAEPFGDIEFGPNSKMDFAEEHMRWYDSRLKNIDNGIDNEPPIHYFLMGQNIWKFSNSWPLVNTKYTSFYLHSFYGANTIDGDGNLSLTFPEDEPTDNYTYDPDNPVPSLGGQIMASKAFYEMMNTTSGPLDRRPIYSRKDILIYTSEELLSDIEVTGPIKLILYASSSCYDTDFTGTLIDVHPDGKSIIICEGLIRARFRDSIEIPNLIDPEEVYEYHIDMWETSNLFKAGHKIRLEVSSSNHPRFDRNLNTGMHPADDMDIQIANQKIFHNSKYPSRLIIPIIPN